MPKNIMEIDSRFLSYSEKIARAYSAVAQNSTLWKSTFRHKSALYGADKTRRDFEIQNKEHRKDWIV